ncbi:MAG: acyl-CoA synthetase [Actinobacteria bacterium]|nr:acyl-CoA synthetase [Actinomycetota bacterium]
MPGPAVSPSFSLADLFEVVADAIPDREALVCDGRRLSFREVDERTNRLAHWLAAQGIGPGDHVAVYLYNTIEYLETMIAAFKLRAVPFNVNYRYVEDELRYLLSDADARAVVFDPEFTERLDAVAPDLPLLDAALSLDGYDAALASSSPDRAGVLEIVGEPRSGDDLYILYTGGTTGMPKGVIWRHEDIFFGAFGGGHPGGDPVSRPAELEETAPRGRARSLPASPFMHGTAHWMAFTALFAGGTVVISPDRRFDPIRLWRLVEQERVTFLTIVGDAFARPMIDALREHGDELDVSSLRVILSGGAVLSPSVKEDLAERLAGTLIVDTYGASESGGQGVVVTSAGSGAVGPRFTMNDETALLDEELHPITAPGVVGRLARRGRVPLGYYKDEEKTAATFPVIDGVRWSVPGDFGVLEHDGTITLLGRGSVSINTGGEKVYPEEVEAALKGHPAVFDAVVVGVPDDRWGERVVAVVQARDGTTPTLEELDAHVRLHVAGYKAPRDLVLVPEIQRAPMGKPNYRWAREVALSALVP